ncbi:MAG: hypothetical protein ACRD1V_18775 [Vicinamibacterales bacterium]
MADPNELQALAAALRGAMESAEGLASVRTRVQALARGGDVADADLDDLQRLSLTNALAAEALRGLIETMLRRRGKAAAAAVAGEGGLDE